ncbi:MAG: SdpI family protein [Chloroflexi bacterium]|nr:SdpI family protein [Chloroflexota bacterium]
MSTKTASIISFTLIGLTLIAGAVLWNRLPEQMASHWNQYDQVDGYVGKPWGVFQLPLVALGLFLLFLAIPNIDPLKANIAQFRKNFNLFTVLIVAFMLYVHGLTLAWNLGYQNYKISAILLPFMGFLFIAIGYLLEKAKRNFFIGIRTPWTLSSDSVWDKTHQVGSTLFMISGVLALIGGLLGGMSAFLLAFVPLVGSSLFLVIYSYILYHNEIKA